MLHSYCLISVSDFLHVSSHLSQLSTVWGEQELVVMGVERGSSWHNIAVAPGCSTALSPEGRGPRIKCCKTAKLSSGYSFILVTYLIPLSVFSFPWANSICHSLAWLRNILICSLEMLELSFTNTILQQLIGQEQQQYDRYKMQVFLLLFMPFSIMKTLTFLFNNSVTQR